MSFSLVATIDPSFFQEQMALKQMTVHVFIFFLKKKKKELVDVRHFTAVNRGIDIITLLQCLLLSIGPRARLSAVVGALIVSLD